MLENMNKTHKSRNVSTPLDSQTALQALYFVQIDSECTSIFSFTCTWNSLQLSCTCGMLLNTADTNAEHGWQAMNWPTHWYNMGVELPLQAWILHVISQVSVSSVGQWTCFHSSGHWLWTLQSTRPELAQSW
jgi:hypothetical protein